MLVVDYCKSKIDFGRIEIQPCPEEDREGLSLGLIAAMTAIDLERDGYAVIIKSIGESDHGE